MKKNEVRLQKIPLKVFLDTLLDLYHFGVEYIDIVGTPDKEQDVIGIMYNRDYMSEDMMSNFEEELDDILDNEEKEFKKDIKLSDDDLNQLT